jgi:hypothetical protein
MADVRREPLPRRVRRWQLWAQCRGFFVARPSLHMPHP